MNEMMKIAVLHEYLKALYEAYEIFQTDYKRLHKRSKMHNTETVSNYYMRWRDKMRAEIRKVERLIALRAVISDAPTTIKPGAGLISHHL